MEMSLGRAALVVLSCAGWACDDAGDGVLRGGHEPAHPSLQPPADGSSGAPDDGVEPTGGLPASCPEQPWVLSPDLKNARDVGGTPLAAGGHVACGSIFRGPPLTLTTPGCEQARALGFRTIIDLRVDSERSARPDATCTGADFVTAPLPIPYGLSGADYLADLNAADSIARVFHTFGDPERYPIYFHCTWGRDRTGVVAAVLLLTLGVSPDDVMAEYLLSQASVGAYPNALSAVLSDIEARGGPEAFLSSIGITADEIAVMRSHVVE